MYILAAASGKGGVGKTTVVANLGVALGILGKRCLILDLNTHTPDLNFQFGYLSERLPKLSELLQDCPSKLIKPNQYVWAGFCSPSPELELGRDSLDPLTQKLEHQLDYLILDCGPGTQLEFLEKCDLALVVTTPQISAVMGAKRVLDQSLALNRMIVLNQSDTSGLINYEIEQLLDGQIAARIPYDPRFQKCLILGIPFILRYPNSKPAHEFMRLAAALSGMEYRPIRSIWDRIKYLFWR